MANNSTKEGWECYECRTKFHEDKFKPCGIVLRDLELLDPTGKIALCGICADKHHGLDTMEKRMIIGPD